MKTSHSKVCPCKKADILHWKLDEMAQKTFMEHLLTWDCLLGEERIFFKTSSHKPRFDAIPFDGSTELVDTTG